MNLSKTALKAIDAYGGMELWLNAKQITANVSAKGLAFTFKQRPFFENATIEMDVTKPFSKLTPIGKRKNIIGVFGRNKCKIRKP